MMATRFDGDVDAHCETSAENAFTSEGGHVAAQDEALAGPAQAARERTRLMSKYSIRFDGRRYQWHEYQYDRLADAVVYARLMHSRPTQPHGNPLPVDVVLVDLPSPSPSPSDRRLMATLSIVFEADVYKFGGFRYDRLADAASYALKHQCGDALK